MYSLLKRVTGIRSNAFIPMCPTVTSICSRHWIVPLPVPPAHATNRHLFPLPEFLLPPALPKQRSDHLCSDWTKLLKLPYQPPFRECCIPLSPDLRHFGASLHLHLTRLLSINLQRARIRLYRPVSLHADCTKCI